MATMASRKVEVEVVEFDLGLTRDEAKALLDVLEQQKKQDLTLPSAAHITAIISALLEEV